MDAQQQADDALNLGLMTTERRPAPAPKIGLQSDTGQACPPKLAQTLHCQLCLLAYILGPADDEAANQKDVLAPVKDVLASMLMHKGPQIPAQQVTFSLQQPC